MCVCVCVCVCVSTVMVTVVGNGYDDLDEAVCISRSTTPSRKV